jgi:hypothetical protein
MVWAVQELHRLARASPASLEPIRRDQVRDGGEARFALRIARKLRALVLLGACRINIFVIIIIHLDILSAILNKLSTLPCVISAFYFVTQGPTRTFLLAPLVQSPIPPEHIEIEGVGRGGNGLRYVPLCGETDSVGCHGV